MKKISVLSLVFLFLTSTAIASISESNTVDPAKEKEIKTRLGVLQIPFIKNESQIKDSKVKYYANTFSGTVFVTDDGITYALRGGSEEHGASRDAHVGANLRVSPEQKTGWVIKERFVNARKTKAVGIEKAETKVSYFKGKDQKNWESNIPTYKEISLGEVYDHITLNLKAYGKNIEKLFVVEKDGKPEDIAIKLEGAKGLKVNEKGELEIETGIGTIKMTKPVAYQEIDGQRVQVAVNYSLLNSSLQNSTLNYTFKAASYNQDYPLIIDPLLASTFVGGSDYDGVSRLAIDSKGNVFIGGGTRSSDFPTTSGAYDRSYEGGKDAIVSKLNKGLTSLLASTFIGGSNDESVVWSLAIDSKGNVFIAGHTYSSDFPTTEGAYDRSYEGGDAFVSKLNNNLTTLMASTLIGGSADEEAGSLGIDSSGNVFIAGWTYSSNYPTTRRAYDRSHNGNADIFVSKFNNSLTTLMASTFIGGENEDEDPSLTIDSSGNVVVVGSTESPNYPTTEGAYDRSHNGGHDWFISKFNNRLKKLLASTFVGGSDEDRSSDLVIDSSGNILVIGWTRSPDYPTTPGAYDRSYNGGGEEEGDVFVSKLDDSLTTLLASTFIGGSNEDSPDTLAIDSSGDVFVTGSTESSNFPVTADAYDTSINGDADGFVAKFDDSLTTLLASTFIGGSGDDGIRGLAIDSKGNVFIAGWTSSSNYPTTSGAYDTSFNGGREEGQDIFVSKLDNDLE